MEQQLVSTLLQESFGFCLVLSKNGNFNSGEGSTFLYLNADVLENVHPFLLKRVLH